MRWREAISGVDSRHQWSLVSFVDTMARRAKYYRLTASGRRRLSVEAGEWERMSAAIGRVMKLA